MFEVFNNFNENRAMWRFPKFFSLAFTGNDQTSLFFLSHHQILKDIPRISIATLSKYADL